MSEDRLFRRRSRAVRRSSGGCTPLIESYAGRDYQSRTLSHAGRQAGDSCSIDSFAIGSAISRRRNYQYERCHRLCTWAGTDLCPSHNYWYGSEAWYFVHDGKLEGHGYFVGYDKQAKAKIGYIGAQRFPSPTSRRSTEQFPVDGRRMSQLKRYGGACADLSCYGERRRFGST